MGLIKQEDFKRIMAVVMLLSLFLVIIQRNGTYSIYGAVTLSEHSEDKYEITCYNIGNGVITCKDGNPEQVVSGSSISFEIAPDEGYFLDVIKVDGKEIEEDNEALTDNNNYSYTYKFDRVSSNHTIEVVFKDISESQIKVELDSLVEVNGLVKKINKNGQEVLIVLKQNDEEMKLDLQSKYQEHKIWNDNSKKFEELQTIYESTFIESITVKNGRNIEYIALKKPVQIIIDKEEPKVIAIQTDKWSSVPIDLFCQVTDEGGSEISEVRYSVDENEYDSDFYSYTNDNKLIYDVSKCRYILGKELIDDCNILHTYYFWSYDNAGNKSECTSADLGVDTEIPKITSFNFKSKGNVTTKNVINLLTFGTFCKEVFEVTVAANDNESGVNKITLYNGSGVEVETKKASDKGVATFILLAYKFNNNEISASVIDNVGRVSDIKKPTEVDTNANSNLVTIESIKPTITITADKQEYTDSNGRLWYSEDASFDISIGDNNSGINSVEVVLNDKIIIKDKNGKEINKQFSETKTNKEQCIINTNQGIAKRDGSYTIRVIAVDNSGNRSENSRVIYKDTQAARITKFEFSSVGIQEVDENNITTKVKKYGCFFRKNTKVTICASDDTPASGVKSITYYTVDVDGTRSKETTVKAKNNKISFNIKANFKGQIYAKTMDNVANISSRFVNPNSVIIENKNKHREEKHIAFKKAVTEYKDSKGLDLYAKDTKVFMTVTDTYSGLSKVEWEVIAPYDTKNNQRGSVGIGDNKKFLSGSGGWKKARTEKNLVTEMTKTLIVDSDSDSIEVWVRITDRAGNISEDITTLSIDKTRPMIDVIYDNNLSDSQFIDFYKNSRTATIVITERNFDPNDVSITITNTDETIPVVSSWVTSKNLKNPNKTIHTATISYVTDGDYTFDITYKDNAKNIANKHTKQRFTIDKTIPTVSVSYDNNNAENDNCFNQNRTATIVVKEHNFDTSCVEIIGTAIEDGSNIEYPKVSDWISNGDIHIAKIKYAINAKYTLEIECRDKAGNNVSGFNKQEFYVDKTAPILKISGIQDKSSNNGDVVPIITYSDTNFNSESIDIELIGVNRGVVKAVGKYKNIHNGQVYTFDDFERDKENDDIYTLKASVEDFAGNRTTSTITFSVNRFGSIYVIDDDIKEIEGKYVKKERDVILTEINVDNLNQETIKVRLTLNGTPRELIKNQDYTVTLIGGNWKWSKYEYRIGSSLFSGDGIYSVAIYSVDEAGNVNESIDEVKSSEITFGIDKTAPVAVAIDLDPEKQYAIENKSATISVTDNLVLDSVAIYLNDKLIEPIVDGENYTFNISSLNSKQNVRVVALDLAGNEYVLNIEEFLVTTNLFYRWFNNMPLFIGSLLSVSLLIVFIIFTILYSKKKIDIE